MNSKLLTLFTFLLLLLASSCSEKLTRDQAQELISQTQGFPKDETITFKLVMVPNWFKQAYYQELIDSGYITAPERFRTGMSYFVPQGYELVRIPLTDKGMAFARGKDPNNSDEHYMMKGAQSQITAVTSMLQADSKTYDVEYTVGYGNINAFGRFYIQSQNLPNLYSRSLSRRARILRYDDGWHVQN